MWSRSHVLRLVIWAYTCWVSPRETSGLAQEVMTARAFLSEHATRGNSLKTHHQPSDENRSLVDEGTRPISSWWEFLCGSGGSRSVWLNLCHIPYSRMVREPCKIVPWRAASSTSAACFCPHFSPRSRLHAWLHLEMCGLDYLLTNSLKGHELYWLLRAEAGWNKLIESKWKLQQLSERFERGICYKSHWALLLEPRRNLEVVS